jgi:hypothetical protein
VTWDDDGRSAYATIRGYLYQFDATVLSILDLPPDAHLTVEGVEDYDVAHGALTDLFQCKYYESAKLTPATLRDAILPMLRGFLALPARDRPRRRLHLYGHFKESTSNLHWSISVDNLKNALVRRERSNGPSSPLMTINLQEELGASDDDLRLFVDQLHLHTTEDFDTHKATVIAALRRHCGVTPVEAECFLYPSARTLVSSLAARANPTERQTSRDQFLSKVTPSRALFNAWSLREHTESDYCATLRLQYFSERNIEPIQRFFVVDASLPGTDQDILSLCHALRIKWSSHHIRRKPDAERFAPFTYFRNLSPDRLLTLKTSLHHEGVRFVDGYPFQGATFDVAHLCSPQTTANQLSLRVISSQADLEKTVHSAKGRRFVYEFLTSSATDTPVAFSNVSIPVTSLHMIENII